MRRATLLLVLVTFIFSIGGQWAVLQAVAWANMIREYSEVVPVTQAVKMTFSGQYPCAMCQVIADRKQSDNSKAISLLKQEKQICPTDFGVKMPLILVASHMFPAWKQSFQTWVEEPPTPPPRFA